MTPSSKSKNISRFSEIAFYICLCVGMTVANTSFTIISGIFEVLDGMWVLLSIIVSGVICLLVSRQIAEVSSLFPSSPGVRTYLKQGFGNGISIYFVYMYLVFMVLGASVESYVFASVAQVIFPQIPTLVIAIIMILSVVLINLKGIETSKSLQIVFTIGLVSALFFASTYGLIHSNEHKLRAISIFRYSKDAALPFITSLGFSLFFFTGFEWVNTLGKGPKSYEKMIPNAMQFSVIVNIIIYTLLSFSIMFYLSKEEIVSSKALLPLFLGRVFPFWGHICALLISILAIISTFNAGILGGSRLIYSLAREGYMPKSLTKISLKTGSPIIAILFLGVSVIIFTYLMVSYELVFVFALLASCIICIVYAMILWSLIRIRVKNKRTVFVSKLPLIWQWVIIVFLIAIGTGALFSMPQLNKIVVGGAVILILVVSLATKLSIAQNKK